MRVEPWVGDPGRVAELTYSLGKKGAKVLVIRNTVATAQAVFDELLLNEGGDELALAVAGVPAVHHSRFAVEDRRLLDDAVEQVLGASRSCLSPQAARRISRADDRCGYARC